MRANTASGAFDVALDERRLRQSTGNQRIDGAGLNRDAAVLGQRRSAIAPIVIAWYAHAVERLDAPAQPAEGHAVGPGVGADVPADVGRPPDGGQGAHVRFEMQSA